MHWHPPQNQIEARSGLANLHSGLNSSKINACQFQSSHYFRFRSFHLSNFCMNKYNQRSISKSNFCLGFLSIGPNYAYLPSVVKNSNIRRPVLRMLLCLHELWPSLSSPERTFRAQGMCKVRHAEDSTSNQFLNLKETAAWRHQSIQQHPPLTA